MHWLRYSIFFILLTIQPLMVFAQFDDTIQGFGYSEIEKTQLLAKKALDLFDKGELEQSLILSKSTLNACRKFDLLELEAHLLLNVGMIYRIQGDFQLALDYLSLSHERARALGMYNNQGAALNQIGTIFRLQGNYSGALEHLFDALSAFQHCTDKVGVATVQNNIGIVYFYQGNFEKSLEYYLASFEFEKDRADEYGMCISYINIGEVYKMLKRYDEALDYYDKALALATKNEDKDPDGDLVGIIFNEIGSIYSLLDNYELSLNYLKKALSIFLKINNRQRLAESRINLAQLAIKTNDLKQAECYLMLALDDANSIPSLDLQSRAHKMLSTVYEAQHLNDKAFEHFKAHIHARDSIFNEDQMTRMVETEMLFQFDKKMQQAKFEQEAKDIIMRESLKRQRLVRNFQLFALVILVIGSVYMYGAYKDKQRKNTQLQTQQVHILQKNKELLQNHEEIRQQRDEIEKQNIALEESQNIIKAKNDRVISSIEYAQTIQQAILPPRQNLLEYFPKHLVYNRPKDIVSGDFYWFSAMDNLQLISVVDCTGHGVPGAFMSLIGYTLLNQIVIENKVIDPSKILMMMHKEVHELLNQNGIGRQAYASMDISFAVIDRDKKIITFAGAGLPLYVVNDGEASIIKGDIFSVGGYQRDSHWKFDNHEINITPELSIYLTTDGYLDQMNPELKKFGRKQFLQMLEDVNQMECEQRKEYFHKSFEAHKGKHEQLDDVCVLGINFSA